jgi:hypothetical protein
MLRPKRTGHYHAVVLLLAFGLCAGPASSARAQGLGAPYGGFAPGTESTDSENSRAPFQFTLGGVLNPPSPQAASLATLTLRVGNYHEIYRFEVRTATAPEFPEMNTTQVLKSLAKYVVQLHVVGDKELLTKIGQSLPGTPLTVTGLLTRRYRQLQILSVDVFSMDSHLSRSPEEQ